LRDAAQDTKKHAALLGAADACAILQTLFVLHHDLYKLASGAESSVLRWMFGMIFSLQN
jgi:hypothetical protein